MARPIPPLVSTMIFKCNGMQNPQVFEHHAQNLSALCLGQKGWFRTFT
jgi:hypothetical protein